MVYNFCNVSRFELAIQLGELKIAYEIAMEDQVWFFYVLCAFM